MQSKQMDIGSEDAYFLFIRGRLFIFIFDSYGLRDQHTCLVVQLLLSKTKICFLETTIVQGPCCEPNHDILQVSWSSFHTPLPFALSISW